jgi:hypothetical protein
MFKKVTLLLLGILFISWIGFAHQPRFPNAQQTIISSAEISKAYYARLSGNAQQYQITEDAKFNLYVNVLVPAIANQKKDVSAIIFKNGNRDTPFATLDGNNFQRTYFFEEFGTMLTEKDQNIRVWWSQVLMIL